MTKLTRLSIACLTLLALAGLLLLGNRGEAGSSAAKLQKQVQVIADAIEKGDNKKADELAKKLAEQEEEVYYVMLLFKPRNRKGFGVGDKANEIIPDGIELKIRALSRDLISAAKLAKEKEALIEMAYRTHAITKFAGHLAPKKGKADWLRFCEESEKACTEFIAAVKSGSTAEVKKTASKINTNCNNCHSKFR